jgi:hypothetical protein
MSFVGAGAHYHLSPTAGGIVQTAAGKSNLQPSLSVSSDVPGFRGRIFGLIFAAMFLTRPGGSTQAFFPGSRDCKDKHIFQSGWWIGARSAGKREAKGELSLHDKQAEEMWGQGCVHGSPCSC